MELDLNEQNNFSFIIGISSILIAVRGYTSTNRAMNLEMTYKQKVPYH